MGKVVEDKRTILEWLASTEFQHAQLSGWVNERHLEVWFPQREDLYKPGERIDAALTLNLHPQWPKIAKRPISKPEFLRILMAVTITDSIHEIMESITVDGEKPWNPHPENENDMWDCILDVAQAAGRRIVKEYKYGVAE